MADSPTINGVKFGWASVSMGLDGVDTEDFVEINHKWATEYGDSRGKGSRSQGAVLGDDTVEGDVSFKLAKWVKILAALKAKYGSIKKAVFPITIQHSATGEDEIVTEELIGVRIAGGEHGYKPGPDQSIVKVPLHILRYKINGIDPQED